MEPQEAIEMMRRASGEIKTLRGTIGHLHPKADAYDTIRQITDLMPQRSQGMGEDVAWRLDQRIREIEAKLANPEKEKQ